MSSHHNTTSQVFVENKKHIIIYKDTILPRSETFILNPAESYERYVPLYLGSLRVPGLPMPEARVITVNGSGRIGRIRQALKLRLLGHNGVSAAAERLRAYKPALIQAHFGIGAINLLPLVEKLQIPLIVYYHGYDATITDEFASQNQYTRRYLRMLPQLIEQTSLFLTHSDFLREKLIERGFPADRIETHYVGVEAATEAPLPLEEREPVIFFAARLVEKKGLSFLIEAMRRVQKQHPECELVVAGSGPLAEAMKQRANAYLTKVRFIGWQTPAQIADWMRRVRIFCMPSVAAANGDSEGFGMVFIEAQRVGTPVVSFAHGGIPEAVAHERSGLLAPEHDVNTLAQYLLRLYEDEALWRQYSQAAYDRTLNDFNLKTLAHRLEDRYDALLAGH